MPRNFHVQSLLLALFALAAFGCEAGDEEVLAPEITISPEPWSVRLECRVDAAAGTLGCGPTDPTSSGSNDPRLSPLIMGGQDRYVRLSSTNVSSDGTTLSADVRVQNLTIQNLASTDGSTPSPEGVRVFFHEGPSSGVVVANADGTGTFTASNQPYFEYSGSSLLDSDEILTAVDAETTGGKTWQFTLNGASTFTFSVYVVADVADASAIAVSFETVSGAINHTCGLTSSGKAWCWGSNSWGQLGDGSTTQRIVRRAVDQSVYGGITFAQISPGENHTCAVTPGGQAYCWGYNGLGQLGDGTTTDRRRPAAVDQSAGISFTQVITSVGQNHSCGLTTDSLAYCWGQNDQGQLGNNTTVALYNATPTPVAVHQGSLRFTALTAWWKGTCGLTASGLAYCWGDNVDGAVGDGTSTDRTVPTAVDQDASGAFEQLTAGAHHVCGLTGAGQAYCWGFGRKGQLGNGTTTTKQYTPTAVSHYGVTYAGIAARASGACGWTSGGQAYCWGRNDYGGIGDGSTSQRNTPVAVVQTLGGGITFAGIAGGNQITCGWSSSGMAYCWGGGTELGTGLPSGSTSTTPAYVAGTR